MSKTILLILALAFTTISCTTKIDNFITIKDGKFVDSKSRTIILNGINHVNKNKNKANGYYVHSDDEQIFRKFRDWGFNCIRYGIIWDGLEPEPGVINEEYLKEIDKRVRWASENNIYLILDMHQDLYSQMWADGAPRWATITDSLPHLTGPVWSDAYMMSPALHRAFDNFWNNTPASDGVGIQDHYINVWKVVAERYADSVSVIGYDIMNEPFIGSDIKKVLAKLIEAFSITLESKGVKLSSPEEYAVMWMDAEQRGAILKMLGDKETFRQITSHTAPAIAEFEEGPLSEFYQKTRDAIRSVDKRHILFLEHDYFGNLGIPAAFKIPIDSVGQRDPLCAYAPHAYDLVTDTKDTETPSMNRVENIYEQIIEFGLKQNLPIIVGEWGAYYMGYNCKVPATFQTNIIERNQLGQTYWTYWDKIETQDYFPYALSRHYPMAINGTLVEYLNDFDNTQFRCQWNESSSNATTVIYLPSTTDVDTKITLEPSSDYDLIPLSDSTGLLTIKPIGKLRTLTISTKK